MVMKVGGCCGDGGGVAMGFGVEVFGVAVVKMTLVFVRLNLFNHVLALFHAKFACNLTIRYLVFMWELYKGSV